MPMFPAGVGLFDLAFAMSLETLVFRRVRGEESSVRFKTCHTSLECECICAPEIE
jgi:hypothetical protein